MALSVLTPASRTISSVSSRALVHRASLALGAVGDVLDRLATSPIARPVSSELADIVAEVSTSSPEVCAIASDVATISSEVVTSSPDVDDQFV